VSHVKLLLSLTTLTSGILHVATFHIISSAFIIERLVNTY